VFEVFIALKFAGTNPQKGNAIAVLGVEVGVNFKYKPRKFWFIGFYIALGGSPWQWIWRDFDESIEEFLNSKAV
jgi:hypothetical protein